MLGVGIHWATLANTQLTGHYNDAFSEHLLPDSVPSALYDAFYLLAYAAVAAGEEVRDGYDLARAGSNGSSRRGGESRSDRRTSSKA